MMLFHRPLAAAMVSMLLTGMVPAYAGIICPDRPPAAATTTLSHWADSANDSSASVGSINIPAIGMTLPTGTFRSIETMAIARGETLADRWVETSFQSPWPNSNTDSATSHPAMISLPTVGISSHMGTLAERFIRPVGQTLWLESRKR